PCTRRRIRCRSAGPTRCGPPRSRSCAGSPSKAARTRARSASEGTLLPLACASGLCRRRCTTMMLHCRLLPYAVADGPHNMAADEVLLEAAFAGVASLRFYGWTTATVSLGYFQPERVRLDDGRLAGLPFVRRPSRGGTLVHHHEV